MMDLAQPPQLVRQISLIPQPGEDPRELLRREWLVTNGLGGYASGTISGSVSRRYHGLLVAALPAPLGRVVMFNHLAEFIHLPDGRTVQIGGEEPTREGDHNPFAPHYITEFRLENHLPVWRMEIDGVVIEKRVLLVHGQNTVYVHYELLTKQDAICLDLRPSFHFRGYEHDVGTPLTEEYVMTIRGHCYELSSSGGVPPMRLLVHGEGANFTHDGGATREISYEREAERGYRSRGLLWSGGYFSASLRPQRGVTLVGSTEDWAAMQALSPKELIDSEAQRRQRLIEMAHPNARTGSAAELVLAADQFIMTPAGRIEDAARARAMGDEIRSVIAGYHWFTDWGRDTMISLEGLTLSTGRHNEACWILRTFAHYVRDGLIPNYFPDGENQGVYHTADATLWYFHAIDRYLRATSDRSTLRQLLPVLRDIIDHHLRGTRFGIGVDHRDGLLKQGAEGYQLTWMDAKVDGWVVTPRRGKAVEINALWYNALRLLERWSREEEDAEAARPFGEHATRARESFNKRFWYENGGYLYDVVAGEHGADTACRPNQVFAISLPNPVLDEARWAPVLEVAKQRLHTPVGLRSLAPGHPDYKSHYFGDLRARDAAYHQGTVWGWLIGPFIDAWLKVHPEDKAGARHFLDAMLPHLDHACVGSISEIFDAEAPFTPRGCIAQAWSVAEALRCWVKTA
jgi:predicted glycogen debranching enzyme